MTAAEKSERITVKFIKDEPSEIDFFGSHSRVAAAVSNVISEDNGINVVGLLGSWGSGKSTVVSQIQKRLEGATPEIHFFKFDAWLYQNDPPRRSFLEALIQDLSQNALSNDAQWAKRLADLSGRSEETVTETNRNLSSTGKWIFASLGLVPVGTVFLAGALDSENLANASWMLLLGMSLTLAPLITAFLFYICWRPWRAEGLKGLCKKDFWIRHREKHASESIFALLTNQSVERTEKITKISPEPSVTEFRSVFRDILKNLRSKRERLIIVIDNLDRLAESEAVELWATIRSLFLGNEINGSQPSEITTPTIILPIDEGSIRRMFSASGDQNDADELAQSFMDKTFDLSFHVNDPVMSDWRAFFREKLIEAFSDAITDERVYWATKFVEERFSNATSPRRITPRLLVKLVNSVGVLAKQWNDGSINFLSMVFFALHRSEIALNPREFVKAEWPSIAAAFGDWQRDIVALHYGVPRDKAFQTLLEDPLRMAIASKNEAEFSNLVDVVGFGPVFEEVIANLPASSTTPGPQADFVANAALLVSKSSVGKEQWVTSSMPNLASAWCNSGQTDTFRDDFDDIFKVLAPFTDGRTFVQASANKLALSLPKSGISDENSKAFIKALSSISQLSKNNGLQTPLILIPIEIQPLLYLISCVPENLRSMIRTDKMFSEILTYLTNSLADEKLSGEVPSFIQSLASTVTINFKDRSKIAWDDIVSISFNNIVNYNSSFHSVGPSIDIFGILYSKNQNAKTNVQQLFDQGYLNTRLGEADQNEDDELLADIAALMFLRGTDFAGPNGKSWSQVMKSDEKFVGHFKRALTSYLWSNPTMAVHRATKTHPTLKAVITELVKHDIVHESAGGLTTNHIVLNIKHLEGLVGAEPLAIALNQAARRSNFWTTVEEMEDGAAFHTAIETLAQIQSVDRTALIDIVRKRLLRHETSNWKQAVTEGASPFDLAKFYGNILGQAEPLGDLLKSGLQELVQALLQSSEEMRQRWFYLNRFVSRNVRVTMLKNLRDQIQSGSPAINLIELVKANDGQLFIDAKFHESPDKTTRHVTMPLMQEKSGLSFIHQNVEIFAKCLRESDEETRQAARESLEALKADDDEDQLGSLLAIKKAFS